MQFTTAVFKLVAVATIVTAAAASPTTLETREASGLVCSGEGGDLGLTCTTVGAACSGCPDIDILGTTVVSWTCTSVSSLAPGVLVILSEALDITNLSDIGPDACIPDGIAALL
ncbi:hypothetical protein BD309DRAFT_165473 [Dichomitus squalens]|uniref:Uncharacterized protein n=1 Tax=Dichomitus squalens TaxID=114155 RepID=A0A4Q9NPJ1_9APHY|nr:hypothetical protein BD309DRAFT_165473 [Dichomitus squalens]TBU52909.1 hypothetical protein BD310DRAFT_939154 [Dichomitus squalens]